MVKGRSKEMLCYDFADLKLCTLVSADTDTGTHSINGKA